MEVEETLRSHKKPACHADPVSEGKTRRLDSEAHPIIEYVERQVGELGHCGAM